MTQLTLEILESRKIKAIAIMQANAAQTTHKQGFTYLAACAYIRRTNVLISKITGERVAKLNIQSFFA